VRRRTEGISPPAVESLNQAYLETGAGPSIQWAEPPRAGLRWIEQYWCHWASNRARKAGYSMTSSTRARRIGGTVRPSALAVLRLITSSNFVGSTGISAGVAPFKILSTWAAARR
jgi:hypothetical protein